MGLKSKDIIILFVGLILPIIFSIAPIFNTFGLNNFVIIYIILLIILFCVGAILWAFYERNNELKNDLDFVKLEHKKLSEKLKIYERLSKIEVILGI